MTKVKCKHCGDILESFNGEYKRCSCNKTFLDATKYYIRTTPDAEWIKEILDRRKDVTRILS